MGKMMKKRKKGRPPKSDLAKRTGGHRDPRPDPPPESEQLRRSSRRRNLNFVGSFDEFEEEDEIEGDDEEEDEEEEDERRREKKLKLVLKLHPHQQQHSNYNNKGGRGEGERVVDSVSRGSVGHVSGPDSRGAVSASSSEYGEEKKPFKKRKIDDDDDDNDNDHDVDDVDEDDNGQDNDVVDDDDCGGGDVHSIGSGGDPKKKVGRNVGAKGMDSVSGSPSDSPAAAAVGVPLPNIKQLELILDKLQKKDTYGVYAEPVDLEELPDYLDVIEHPMDFGTIRKKLASGAYPNLEQFENDVFLVCTNAMQYNAPETVYFKQARSIQELAKKKFQRLRADYERVEAEQRSEQKSKSSSVAKKPLKKSLCKTIQEPVGSDFSSGATLATTGDALNGSNMIQTGAQEKPSNAEGPVDGNFFLSESKQEKAEDQLFGKGLSSKLGKRSSVLDENRRATYDISNHSLVRSESTFTIFEGENKQLVAVGLHAEYAYARSLARFAAAFGPVAWKVASRRIEQALPAGFKFGRGWVGEYEPLPTPVVMVEKNKQKPSAMSVLSESMKVDKSQQVYRVGMCESFPTPLSIVENKTQKQLVTKLTRADESRKDESSTTQGSKASQDDVQLGLRTNGPPTMTAVAKFNDPLREHPFIRPTEGMPGLFVVPGINPTVNTLYQQQNPLPMNLARTGDNALKQVELNHPYLTGANMVDIASQKQVEHASTNKNSGLLDMVSMNRNLVQSVPFKQPESNGSAAGGLPNRKVTSTDATNNKVDTSAYDFIRNQQARAAAYFPRGNHGQQALSDPVQMMRTLAEKTQSLQKSSNSSMSDEPQMRLSDSSSKRDDSSAAAAAARAWMTLGAAPFKPDDISGSPKMQIAAASLYNPTREVPQTVLQHREETPVSRGLQLQSGKNNFSPRAIPAQAAHIGVPGFHNNRPILFPQLVTTDLSRSQVQSPWSGLVPHTQQNKKQDTLPPDLNIGFQSSGSPVRQSSGIMVDSQQPDLALQL